MTRLYLVRHGRAAARYDEEHDPGLDDVGRKQAQGVAEELASFGPLALVTSPLRRTRETASAFEERSGVSATVEPAIGEIKSLTDDLDERGAWLTSILEGECTWAELDAERRRWRDGVVSFLADLDQDTVVVSHYIAINAAVGAATGDDRVANFRPDNCSCTTLDVDGGSLRLVQLGRQAATAVRAE